jgi:phytoene synthase
MSPAELRSDELAAFATNTYHPCVTTPTQSLSECRRIARRSRSSFRFAFAVLAADQRNAMNALYAFFRLSDDLGDDPALGSPEVRRHRLQQWRMELDQALAGRFSHPIHEALRWAVLEFGIPPRYLHDVLDGCESDLDGRTMQTFEELRGYCYRVASAVGLACIRVWGLKPGCSWEEAEPPATEAGYAFQLTNILRDLGTDARAGRVYLPADELARYGLEPQTWLEPGSSGRLQGLLDFQIERARNYYRSSERLNDLLSPRGRAIHGLMRDAYSGLLERIARAGPAALTRRVRLTRREKLQLFGGVVFAKLRTFNSR